MYDIECKIADDFRRMVGDGALVAGVEIRELREASQSACAGGGVYQ